MTITRRRVALFGALVMAVLFAAAGYAQDYAGVWNGTWDGAGGGGGFELTLEKGKDGALTGKVSVSATNLFGVHKSKGSQYYDLSANLDLGSGFTLTRSSPRSRRSRRAAP